MRIERSTEIASGRVEACAVCLTSSGTHVFCDLNEWKPARNRVHLFSLYLFQSGGISTVTRKHIGRIVCTPRLKRRDAIRLSAKAQALHTHILPRHTSSSSALAVHHTCIFTAGLLRHTGGAYNLFCWRKANVIVGICGCAR
jgi:hypothetical protein